MRDPVAKHAQLHAQCPERRQVRSSELGEHRSTPAQPVGRAGPTLELNCFGTASRSGAAVPSQQGRTLYATGSRMSRRQPNNVSRDVGGHRALPAWPAGVAGTDVDRLLRRSSLFARVPHLPGANVICCSFVLFFIPREYMHTHPFGYMAINMSIAQDGRVTWSDRSRFILSRGGRT